MCIRDRRNRVKRVEAVENATLISIHQNTFPESNYHGAQVFYANEASSLPLAQLLQDNLRSALDPSNSRVPMKIPDSVYPVSYTHLCWESESWLERRAFPV